MRLRVCVSAVILLLQLASLARLRTTFAQEKSPEGLALRSQVDLVSVYFTVRDDKKHLVSDLPQDSFSVAEDGQPQAVKFFAHHTDVVLNVGLLLDTGSNMPQLLGEESGAATTFLRRVVRPTDLGF